MVVNTAVWSGSFIIWISKNSRLQYWIQTNKQNMLMRAYKALLGTYIKSKKVAYIYIYIYMLLLAKLSTWCFEHSGDFSCSLLVNPSHTDESWEGRNMCMWIYALNLFIEHSGEHWWEQNIFCSFTSFLHPKISN